MPNTAVGHRSKWLMFFPCQKPIYLPEWWGVTLWGRALYLDSNKPWAKADQRMKRSTINIAPISMLISHEPNFHHDQPWFLSIFHHLTMINHVIHHDSPVHHLSPWFVTSTSTFHCPFLVMPRPLLLGPQALRSTASLNLRDATLHQSCIETCGAYGGGAAWQSKLWFKWGFLKPQEPPKMDGLFLGIN